MKGSTHLAIGIVIGAAAAAYYPFTPLNAAAYVGVAAVSALSADLDGPSILSSKLGKLSKLLYTLVHGGGWLLVGAVAYLYAADHYFNLKLAIFSIAALLTGLFAGRGAIRNFLVTVVGGGLLYGGVLSNMAWLIGLGLFVGIAPWLKHRGMTHTVWAVIAWGAIGYGLERELQLEGIMRVAVIGYVSHLVADTLTPSGVKWLYPIYKKSIKLL
ncbi:metal-dependent hydrolase [Paenibacillus sp. NEAU-GSW1]|uniref:metal-dependent hydrolase n=1 Tax=Paenibacillus sp. NEAU-GSW1 TaxID=2682486 RepID=UPI0012E30FE3|nr:metal-dependent hydrolase [Paenibacillus sp. NEAU-GSW1]MUT67079.1 metal-dependent hydrolase [Paenibacillus sp. NEAU-GSW1]